MCWIAVIHSQQFEDSQNENPDLLEILQEHRFYRKLIRAIEKHPHKAEMAFLHSSLIVRGGNILAIGINTPNQNGFCRSYASYDQVQLHSEFSVVNQIRRKIDLRGATIYNCRMTRGGKIAMSKPCETCEEMLRRYGFKKAVYTTETGIEVMKIGGGR